METRPILKWHHDEDGKPTGFWECSICGEQFLVKQNPADLGEHRRIFAAHIMAVHGGKKPRED